MPADFDIIRDTTPAAAIRRGLVLAIGNFDGVHRGHRAVIAAAREMARRLGRPAYSLTFEPHPRDYFNPDSRQFRLSGERDKLRLLAGTGLDGAVVMTFDATRAATTAQDFINQDLIGRLGAAGVVAGYDFHFGKSRAGTPAFLEAEGRRLGFSVHIEPRRQADGLAVSSGVVRDALVAGDVGLAATLLGGPWFVSGEVVHGAKRGRDLGYPTANIALDPACGLAHGVYAVRVGRGAERFEGVANFGRRPMFDNGPPLLEIHLFDFAGDLYGAALDVAFIAFLRAEASFAGVDALIRQMDADSGRARTALAASQGAFPLLGELPG
ncbi:MAG: bifunctional riboflavin kinase/FAD synthetase [Xanthobacteraceae bacterium]|nr:MAG: bifunctional riboflavin kinase/FAD synthetase [Xanthobacteraceae bacterium]